MTEALEKRQCFLQRVLAQPDIPMREKESYVDLTLCVRIDSKRITDRKVQSKTMKLLGECIGEDLGDLEYDKDTVPRRE